MLKFFRLPFATTGDKTAVPDAVDSNGNVSYSQGYGFDYQRQKTDPAAKNIERDKMNQVFFDMTTAIAELQSQGVPDFITSALNGGAAYSYAINSLVRYSGDVYVSLVAANTALPSDATKWALIPTPSRVRDGYNTVGASGGTADAVTVALTPTQTALTPGPTWWRATAANATTTPTLKRDGLAAKTLVKGNNLPLAIGDIPGAGAWMCSQYDVTLDREVLLNPANGVTSSQNFRKNTVLNGDGRVRQGIAINISTSRQYGLADGWLGSLSTGAVSAGTINADNIALGVNKSQVKVAGLTCTGAGVVDFVTRIAGEDAVRYSGKTVMVSALVQHDVGTNINWAIALRKANTLDNFSAVTGLAASGAIAVPTATGTRIFVSATLAASDGDNGLEVLIQATCGAVTTKNFYVTECQVEVGGSITEYDNMLYSQSLTNCLRQYWRIRADNFAAGYTGNANVALVVFSGPSMRSAPALLYSALSDFSLQSGTTSGTLSAMSVSSINNGAYSLLVTTSTSITPGNVAFLRNSTAPWLAFDSRL